MRLSLLKYKYSGILLILLFVSIFGYAQNRTISGTITDYQGEAIIGASVMVKGTQIGTITDMIEYFRSTMYLINRMYNWCFLLLVTIPKRLKSKTKRFSLLNSEKM
jgi:hypothetical protein